MNSVLRYARFAGAGALNTLISLMLYQAALFVMGHLPAYVIAYAAGVVAAYYLYARHVFGSGLSSRGFMLFAAFYLVAGAAGSGVNTAVIDYLGWHARIAIFATVLIMLPLNYLGTRWCLSGLRTRNEGHA